MWRRKDSPNKRKEGVHFGDDVGHIEPDEPIARRNRGASMQRGSIAE